MRIKNTQICLFQKIAGQAAEQKIAMEASFVSNKCNNLIKFVLYGFIENGIFFNKTTNPQKQQRNRKDVHSGILYQHSLLSWFVQKKRKASLPWP